MPEFTLDDIKKMQAPPEFDIAAIGVLQEHDQRLDSLAMEAGKSLAPIVPPPSALGGELGVLDRPDGSRSTEISVTIEDDRLNGGKPTNIPLLVRGQKRVEDLLAGKKPTREQVRHAISRAANRVAGGAALPSYGTIEEATQAASARSDIKGRGALPESPLPTTRHIPSSSPGSLTRCARSWTCLPG